MKRSVSARERFETADGPAAAATRAQILRWLEEVPEPAKRADLRGRLASDDDVPHYSARLEVTLDGMLRARGLSVEYPGPLPGQTTQMDFLVGCADGFYCEATLVNDQLPDRLQRRRLHQLADALDAIVAPFHVVMFVRAPIPEGLRARNVRRFLERQLLALDPAAIQGSTALEYVDAPGDAEPRITFHVVPSTLEPGPVISSWGWADAEMVATYLRIKRVLAYKAGKYGELDRPYVIALWDHTSWSFNEDQILNALFGDLQVVFRSGPGGVAGPAETRRAANGFFTERKPDGTASNRHVSAVAFYRGRLTEAAAEHELLVYHNPHALRPLDPACFAGQPQFVPIEDHDGAGHMEWRDRTDAPADA
jgi:hypothetical protein